METNKIDYSSATLVDVRTSEEFNSGSAPGAISIPLHTLADKTESFKNLKKPIVVFCRSGARSGQATSWLKQNGIDVYNGGGIAEVFTHFNN